MFDPLNDLSLKTIGILLGVLLIGSHAVALARGEMVRQWLLALPRSFTVGVTILSVDLIWTFCLMLKMDWGEFFYLRTSLLALLPVCFFLTVRYVDEFLAVRALGILGLLAAAPILDAAFLQPPVSRLLVVVLAYAYVILGMLWIGLPHLLRDQIGWLVRWAARWQAAVLGGLAYGAAVLVCALAWY